MLLGKLGVDLRGMYIYIYTRIYTNLYIYMNR